MLPCALLVPACFQDSLDKGFGETAGDGDGDPGDGDGDPGDGDGDPGDGDGDPGDGDGDPGDGDGDPGPSCTPEETDCSGECVVLGEDPEHCGACGHDCLGGTCDAGTCAPVELASGKGRLFMALVDQTHVYYGGDGVAVGRIGKDGSDDVVLAPAGPMLTDKEWCYESAFTGDAVVWGNDWVQPGVRGCTVPDCAGGVQTFMPGMNMFTMTYDATNSRLYWNQGADLVSAAWPGGNSTVFLAGQNPRDLATDGDYVYWVARLAVEDYHVRKRAVGGGNMVELALNRPEAIGFAVGGSKLFWGESVGIVQAPLPNGIGGADPQVFANVTGIRKIVADSSHLYWTSQQDGVGTVGRCPLAGCDGPPEILAQVEDPWGITFDPAAIYFVTETGSIYKVAK
ncbi:hypothetical protein DB30_05146 [Enhygromyxa salina]|uniref:Dipeptide-binding ABC transporter, periplasmic substrate-binding component n=1 Tax=Enhygromyxa salina TaxID=215803 RepID=A0A0C1ZDW3_9BACT|nr:hypothetical protein DB30_05146 [Enhygromyxa salina]